MFHKWEDEPTPFIQEIARTYSEDRALYRPEITYRKFLIKWFAIVISMVVVAVCIACALSLLEKLVHFRICDFWVSFLFAFVIEIVWILKWCVIDIIKLYQHYAPEHVRRRCILMPSCSEFAIIAVRKYGLIIGSSLTLYRLNHRCKGTIHRIEYP